MKTITLLLLLVVLVQIAPGQQTPQAPQTDANTPLHQLRPNYPVPYGITKSEDIAAVLKRVHGYLDQVTPVAFVNSETAGVLTDLTKISTLR